VKGPYIFYLYYFARVPIYKKKIVPFIIYHESCITCILHIFENTGFILSRRLK
jgi:hypothetical protein